MLYTGLALVLATTVLVASGCGGSSKSTSSVTTAASSASAPAESANALTREELIAKADAICKRVNEKRVVSVAHTTQALSAVPLALAESEQSANAEMRKLTPPASMATAWNQFLAESQTLAEDTAKLGEYARVHKELLSARQLIAAGQAAQAQALRIAKANGFHECAVHH
jgi:hypothetical protein